MKPESRCLVRAVITVEAAVVMGVVLVGLAFLLRMTLFLHDKAVLSGTVMETAQAARERERAEDNREVSGYFRARIEGKLLYFPMPSCAVSQTEDRVTVRARAANGLLRISAEASAPLTDPEKRIRETIKEENDGQDDL